MVLSLPSRKNWVLRKRIACLPCCAGHTGAAHHAASTASGCGWRRRKCSRQAAHQISRSVVAVPHRAAVMASAAATAAMAAAAGSPPSGGASILASVVYTTAGCLRTRSSRLDHLDSPRRRVYATSEALLSSLLRVMALGISGCHRASCAVMVSYSIKILDRVFVECKGVPGYATWQSVCAPRTAFGHTSGALCEVAG